MAAKYKGDAELSVRITWHKSVPGTVLQPLSWSYEVEEKKEEIDEEEIKALKAKDYDEQYKDE